jgi:hypothetical protein
LTAYPSRHQAEYRYGAGLPAKKAKYFPLFSSSAPSASQRFNRSETTNLNGI